MGPLPEVIVPVDRDKADKIDEANKPSRPGFDAFTFVAPAVSYDAAAAKADVREVKLAQGRILTCNKLVQS